MSVAGGGEREGERGRGRGRGRKGGRSIPAPSQLKEKEVNVHFSFTLRRVITKADSVDKFSPKMDKRSLRAFSVFGPLRCLKAAFASFQAMHKETKYRGMFQAILPCFTHMSGLRRERGLASFSWLDSDVIQRLAEGQGVAGMVPSNDRASGDSAALYRFAPESSEGQGKADFLLHTITKKKLEAFKRMHNEIDWNQADLEKLAVQVFSAIPEKELRCDAVIDLKTDCVSQWPKTRAQLIHYGNSAALSNLNRGFDPRPIYLIAIDATRFQLAIIDPMGFITVDRQAVISGFQGFDAQQTARANWIKKKDPEAKGYFATVPSWTAQTLQQHLNDANEMVRREEETSGISPDKYVVSNLWVRDGEEDLHWNGRGMQGPLLPGTLLLFEGLLRLCCGDKVCDEWTAQRYRLVFGRQHERDITACLNYERESKVSPCRSLDCTYSFDVRSAALVDMRSMPVKPTARFDQGFRDSIDKVKQFLGSYARLVCTSSELLTVGNFYGGGEFDDFKQLLDVHTRGMIGTSIRHIVVDNTLAKEDDTVRCLKAMVIPAKCFPKHSARPTILKDCHVLVCYDTANLCFLSHELYMGSYGRLVVFCIDDDGASSMLKVLEAEVVIVKSDEASLNALSVYLGIKVVEDVMFKHAEVDGNRKDEVFRQVSIVTCRDEVVVYLPDRIAEPPDQANVLELRVSGATSDHFNERLKCILTAATAMNSAMRKGIIPGKGAGFLAAMEALSDTPDPEYNAGARIVKRALEVIVPWTVDPQLSRSRVQMFKFLSPEMLARMDGSEIDLLEFAEATLDRLETLYTENVAAAMKRQIRCDVGEGKKRRLNEN